MGEKKRVKGAGQGSRNKQSNTGRAHNKGGSLRQPPFSTVDKYVERKLKLYVKLALLGKNAEDISYARESLYKICSQQDTLLLLVKKSMTQKFNNKERDCLVDFFSEKNILQLLEKYAPVNADAALAWFRYGGYAELVEEKQKLEIEIDSFRNNNQQADEHIATHDDTSALQSDLQVAKKKIRRLEAKICTIQEEAGKEKLIAIINSVAPSLNELSMFGPAMEQAGIDEDTIAGFSAALQNISDAMIDAGASQIGSVGEEVVFDPEKHYCTKHIARGTPVIVIASGFSIDDEVVFPAVVEKVEA